MIALVWGEKLGPVVSALIRERPGLARRLVFAPRRVVHSVAAYVHHALVAEHGVEHIAREIDQQDVRALLSSAILTPHPRLYRTLERLGPTALALSAYRHLDEVLSGPAADLLAQGGEITENHLDIVDEIVGDPVLLAARKAIGWSVGNVETLQHALTYLRAVGLSRDIEALPPGSGWRAILRRISSDLGRGRGPGLPFALPAEWRHIESVADLWQVGGALGNCVASIRSGGEGYIDGLLNGDAVYLARIEPTMLACIRRVGPNLWMLAEKSISRPGSAEATAAEVLTAGLTASIIATGGQLLDQAPLSAIRNIAWRVERTAENDDLDDLEDAA
jgi:hypothetical protein